MLIKGSEAGKLAGKEGGGKEAAGTHSGAKACEFVCVCGEGSPSRHPCLTSGRRSMLLIKGKENYMHPMPIPFYPRLQHIPPVANGEGKAVEKRKGERERE